MTELAAFVGLVVILVVALFWGLARAADLGDRMAERATVQRRLRELQADNQRQYNVTPLGRTEAVDVKAWLAAAAAAERGDERR